MKKLFEKLRNRKFLGNFLFLLALVILFLTPIGDWLKVQAIQLQLGAPENQLENSDSTLSIYRYNFDLEDSEGRPFQVSQWKGTPVFINFWASWCKPCLAEFHSMEALRDQMPEVHFLFVTREGQHAFKTFVEGSQLKLPLFRQTNGTPPELDHQAIPASFLLNEKGEVVYKHLGAADWSDPSVAESLLNLL